MADLVPPALDHQLEAWLAQAAEPVVVVKPSTPVINCLVHMLSELTDPPVTHVLAADPLLKDAVAEFLMASQAADLVADDVLTLRTTEINLGNQLLLTPDQLITVVPAGEAATTLETEHAEFTETAYDYYMDAWDEAEAFSLRTPGLSRVRETLAEEFGSDVADDFETMLGSVDTVWRGGGGLDVVTICLLVTALHQELLYDISRWGEDIGLASKATFSRTKTRLEERGLIDTEKVPIDVGRPRFRLFLGDDRLRDARVDELAAIARDLLESG